MAITIEELYEIYLDHSSVCTDSRAIGEGDLFFALKGERFDGNTFARDALDKGAAYAIIDDVRYEQDQTILVRDALQTLQRLAAHHRDQFEIPILAITGSNGKTTTKELISAVLSTAYHVHVTEGNLNNHIGLPLTILDMPKETEIAILEMGASGPGEIAAYCEMSRPDHGLITNVGKAHIEGFGSLEGVKRAKGELYDYLRKVDGVVFLPEDEPHLSEMAEGIEHIVRFSSGEIPEQKDYSYKMTIEQLDPNIILEIPTGHRDSISVKSALFGIHNFKNIMAAVAVGRYFKVVPDNIASAIAAYHPSNHRSEWKEIGTNRFLMDCYNANPVSMRAAIESFSRVECEHKILVLGDMLELGPISREEHEAILDRLNAEEWTDIWLVGQEFSALDSKENLRQFEDVQELREWFEQRTFEHTCFLLKGSRGIQLEALVED